VELYKSQVMLRGCETNGYVIASAAKTSLLSCHHRPVWIQQQLQSKSTLVGSVECMQVMDASCLSLYIVPLLHKRGSLY